MKPPPLSEPELAAKVVARYEADGYQVYQEVEGDAGRADIVAFRDPVLIVIETKTALSFQVVAQAKRWESYASAVLIGVPWARPSEARNMAWTMLAAIGVGCLTVKAQSPVHEHIPSVKLQVEPAWRTSFNPRLFEVLDPRHQTHSKAGSSGSAGGQFTRFKKTVYALAEYAQAHPGDPLRYALARVDHHYESIGSAMSSLGAIKAADLARLGVKLEDDAAGIPRVFAVETP